MPLYTYECEECGEEFEMVLRLSEFESITPNCPQCGGEGRRILVLGHGGIQGDEPVWLDHSVREALQDLTDPATVPITTRTQYKKYMKDNSLVCTG